MISISVRLDEKELKKIERIAKDMNLQKSALIRKYILDGYQEAILRKNIELVCNGHLSIEQAAEDAGVSIYKVLDIARQMDIKIGLDESTLKYELKSLGKYLTMKHGLKIEEG
jgi:predicted HTH domain antitoxin